MWPALSRGTQQTNQNSSRGIVPRCAERKDSIQTFVADSSTVDSNSPEAFGVDPNIPRGKQDREGARSTPMRATGHVRKRARKKDGFASQEGADAAPHCFFEGQKTLQCRYCCSLRSLSRCRWRRRRGSSCSVRVSRLLRLVWELRSVSSSASLLA